MKVFSTLKTLWSLPGTKFFYGSLCLTFTYLFLLDYVRLRYALSHQISSFLFVGGIFIWLSVFCWHHRLTLPMNRIEDIPLNRLFCVYSLCVIAFTFLCYFEFARPFTFSLCSLAGIFLFICFGFAQCEIITIEQAKKGKILNTEQQPLLKKVPILVENLFDKEVSIEQKHLQSSELSADQITIHSNSDADSVSSCHLPLSQHEQGLEIASLLPEHIQNDSLILSLEMLPSDVPSSTSSEILEEKSISHNEELSSCH
jgi:hypothetical protein